jgi:DNA-binding phage protein
MPKLAKNVAKDNIEHLNRVLKLDGAMTFQKVLLDNALSHHALAFVAKQAGVRRETIWRYRSGEVRAPFETLVKIVGVIGAKLVIVTD